MQDSIFRAYIRVKNGSTWDWYTDSSGTVSSNTSLTPINALVYMPDGWQTLQATFERRFPQCGVFRTYTNVFRFINDGAKILRHIYDTFGIEAEAQFYIEYYDSTISVDDYAYLFHGDLNFNAYSSEEDFVSIEIIEGEFLSKYDARETTDYKIPVVGDGVNRVWVKLHSCLLPYIARWAGSLGETISEDFNGHGVPSLGFLDGEGTNIHFGTYDQSFVNPIRLWENQSTSSQSFTIEYDYDVICNQTSGANAFFEVGYQVYDITNNNTLSRTTVYQDPTAIASGTTVTKSGTVTAAVTLASNEGIYIEYRIKNGGGVNLPNAQKSMTMGYNTITINFDNPTPVSYFSALRVPYVFRKLMLNIGDNDITTASTLLDDFEDVVLFSGDSLRNLIGGELKTNASEFVSNMDRLFSTALMFDKDSNTISLESKSDAFEDTQVIDLGTVSKVKVTPFTAENFAKYINGYEEYDLDEVTGKDEPFTKFQWLSPMVKTKNEKNNVCTYHASKNRIVLTSLNLNGKTSTDSDNDNEIFLGYIDSSVAGTVPDDFPLGAGEDYYDLYIDGSLTVSNVYDSANLFNIPLSPRRNMLRNEPFLHSILDKLDTKELKYQSDAKTNASGLKMVTDDGATIIDEGADVLIGDMADKIFQPVLIEFEAQCPVNLYATLKANPYGYALFEYKGNSYKGFVMKMSQQFFLDKPQNFQVLAHPTTDLSTLIF